MSLREINGGYGVVARSVMTAPKLSVESKAIYALLCVYAGDETECYPTADTLLDDLGISRSRLYKHLKALIDAGVVERVKKKKGKAFTATTYKLQDTYFKYTQNKYTQNEYTQNEYTQNEDLKGSVPVLGIPKTSPCTQNRYTQNEDTTNNIYINNNINTSVQNPEDETGFSITLKDDSIYKVSAENLAMWKRAYPALDVEGELCRMEAWCNANPTKRKTSKGVEKFINGWLNRSLVDSGSGQGYQNTYRGGMSNHEQPEQYNPEDDPDHVPSVNEVWERLQREGLV